MSKNSQRRGSPRRLLLGALLLFGLPSAVAFFGTRLYAPWEPLERSSRNLELPGDLASRIEQVRQRRSFELPEIAGVSSTSGLSPGEGTEAGHALGLLTPVATQVRADRPNFAWSEQSTPQGGEIRLQLRDGEGQLLIDFGVEGSSTQIDEPLPRGVVLSWQLVSEVGPESAPAAFRILAPDEVPELTNQLAALPNDRALGADLVLARTLVLLDYGLIEEARLELRKARQLPVELQVSLRDSLTPPSD